LVGDTEEEEVVEDIDSGLRPMYFPGYHLLLISFC
jgi:hypothetical protein